MAYVCPYSIILASHFFSLLKSWSVITNYSQAWHDLFEGFNTKSVMAKFLPVGFTTFNTNVFVCSLLVLSQYFQTWQWYLIRVWEDRKRLMPAWLSMGRHRLLATQMNRGLNKVREDSSFIFEDMKLAPPIWKTTQGLTSQHMLQEWQKVNSSQSFNHVSTN